eukprot:Nk52_evm36s2367 gene=Nk52_evmTU36s2367
MSLLAMHFDGLLGNCKDMSEGVELIDKNGLFSTLECTNTAPLETETYSGSGDEILQPILDDNVVEELTHELNINSFLNPEFTGLNGGVLNGSKALDSEKETQDRVNGNLMTNKSTTNKRKVGKTKLHSSKRARKCPGNVTSGNKRKGMTSAEVKKSVNIALNNLEKEASREKEYTVVAKEEEFQLHEVAQTSMAMERDTKIGADNENSVANAKNNLAMPIVTKVDKRTQAASRTKRKAKATEASDMGGMEMDGEKSKPKKAKGRKLVRRNAPAAASSSGDATVEVPDQSAVASGTVTPMEGQSSRENCEKLALLSKGGLPNADSPDSGFNSPSCSPPKGKQRNRKGPRAKDTDDTPYAKMNKRMNANERERRRVKDINMGFSDLKNLLPESDDKHISKVDILKMTKVYIETLHERLSEVDPNFKANCDLRFNKRRKHKSDA